MEYMKSSIHVGQLYLAQLAVTIILLYDADHSGRIYESRDGGDHPSQDENTTKRALIPENRGSHEFLYPRN